jgi:hypothetical protein
MKEQGWTLVLDAKRRRNNQRVYRKPLTAPTLFNSARDG